MFRSSTILSEPVQSLVKVILLLKHSAKLRRILCGDVAVCREMACVLFVVQTDTLKLITDNSSTVRIIKHLIMTASQNEARQDTG